MIDNGLRFEYAVLIAGAGLLVLLAINITYFIRILILKRLKAKRQDVELESKTPSSNPNKFRALFSKFKFSYFVIALNIVLLPLIGFMLYDMAKSPGIIWHYPSIEGNLDNYEKPITVVFDRPINSSIVKPYIFPEIEGEWVVEAEYDWMPFVKRRLRFYPKESMFPGKTFIYYAGITDVLDRTEKWEYGIDAHSVPIPEVASVEPKKGFEEHGINEPIIFHLNTETGPFISWDMKISPKVEFEVNEVDAKTIAFKFKNNLSQNTKYKYEIYRTPQVYQLDTGEITDKGEQELAFSGNFRTVKEPLFASLSPEGSGVLASSDIVVGFDQAMDRKSVEESFSISPNVNGSFNWENDKKMIFNVNGELAKETTYTLIFGKGMRSKAGGFTEKEVKHSFTTIGPVTVTGFYPYGGSVVIGSNLSVTFNQAVDKNSAQSKVSISPSTQGSFYWSGNTLTFDPSGNLEHGTVYTIKVASNVKTINGLNSRKAYSHSFTTAPQVFKLNVPVIYQALRYECNIVSARMALGYKGISRDTWSIYGALPKDNTQYNENKNTWGNPHNGYVGDIYGNQKGYGIYWNPIANYIRSQGRGATVISGWGTSQMLQEVKNGNPVIIWAHNGYSYAGQNISWHLPSAPGGATEIYAVSGMHSYVVKGWIGKMDNPTHIILNDPNRGEYTVSVGYFNSLWGFFGRTGIVVR